MSGKFDYYDAIAHLIPGAIGCLFVLLTLDLLGIVIPKLNVGDFGLAGIGVAVAYTVGHLLQSVASSLEPFFYACWGGMPSIKLLESESHHFSDDHRQALIRELVAFFKVEEKIPADTQGKRSFYQRLFERSMALCNRKKLGRVDSFVAIYGFHRVLLTTFILGFLTYLGIWVIQAFGCINPPPDKMSVLKTMTVLTGICAAIEVFRARKRAYHYAREVLWMTSDYVRAVSSGLEKEDSSKG